MLKPQLVLNTEPFIISDTTGKKHAFKAVISETTNLLEFQQITIESSNCVKIPTTEEEEIISKVTPIVRG